MQRTVDTKPTIVTPAEARVAPASCRAVAQAEAARALLAELAHRTGGARPAAAAAAAALARPRGAKRHDAARLPPARRRTRVADLHAVQPLERWLLEIAPVVTRPGVSLKVDVRHAPAAVGLQRRVGGPAVGQARAAVHGRRALVRDEAPRARTKAQRPVFVTVAGAKRLEVEQLGGAASVARPRVANLAVSAGPAGGTSALGQERVVDAARCATVERRGGGEWRRGRHQNRTLGKLSAPAKRVLQW
eukprot:scaffold117441_cov63-Phaeocystis_antarctica.AAC.2